MKDIIKKLIFVIVGSLCLLSATFGALEDNLVMSYEFSGDLTDSKSTYDLTKYSGTTLSTYNIDQNGDSSEVIYWNSDSYYQATKYGWGGKTSMSVEYWYKSTGSTNYIFQIERNSGSTDWSWYSQLGGAYPVLSTGHNSVTVTATDAVNDGNWHHIVMVYGGGYSKIYIDGSESVSASSTGTLRSFSGGSQHWNWNNAVTPTENMEFSAVRFWNKEISSSEVTELYASGIGCSYDGSSFTCGSSTPTINHNVSDFYNSQNISIALNTSTNTNMSYSLDNGNLTNICSDCNLTTLNLNYLSEGSHSIIFESTDENGHEN